MEELENGEVSGADSLALAPATMPAADVTVTIETAVRIRFQKVKRSWELER